MLKVNDHKTYKILFIHEVFSQHKNNLAHWSLIYDAKVIQPYLVR